MLAGELAPALHHPRRHAASQVLLEAQRPFGLLAIAREHARERRQPRERLAEQLVAVAARPRLHAQLLEPGVEGLAGLGVGDGRAGEDEREGEEDPHAGRVTQCMKEWTLTDPFAARRMARGLRLRMGSRVSNVSWW